MARGFTLVEVAVVAGTALMGVVVAGPIVGRVGPEGKIALSLRNMQVIGAAGGSYRLDNEDYLPVTLTYHPRGTGPGPGVQVAGFCNWSVGGKNNSSWWANGPGSRSSYDVEAADRPLNAYAMPGVEFYAPASPARLPATHPARLNDQAPVFKDAGDLVTHQRVWPAPDPSGISAYDDVGTSYLWNAKWWDQLDFPRIEDRMAEAARRMATGIGARPERFVWMFDEYGDIIPGRSSGPSEIINGRGDVNKAILLMIDGRAGYFTMKPGRTAESYHTANYSLIFE